MQFLFLLFLGCPTEQPKDCTDQSAWWPDSDADGFGDENASSETACEAPGSNWVTNGRDCDDSNAETWPGAGETCDGLDNDCDNEVDEDDAMPTNWYADTDADGYGDPDSMMESCEPVSGYVEDASDCDDTNSQINPDGVEVCDALDNDCNGAVDDGANSVLTWYADTDSDGYGDPNAAVESCDAPSGYVSDNTDCNDQLGMTNPGASEVCDGADNNCDNAIDEGVTSTWYLDSDGDGYGGTSTTTQACSAPQGYVSSSSDCDDSDYDSNPGASEVCDGADNDCDTTVDEGVGSTWYLDSDGDGYGSASNPTQACSAPQGYVSSSSDCDDSDYDSNPGASEVCDGADNDCNNSIDDNIDINGDGSIESDCSVPWVGILISQSSTTDATSLDNLLDQEGMASDVQTMSCNTSLSHFDLLVVPNDAAIDGAGGNCDFASIIGNSNIPVLAMGHEGYDLFGTLGLGNGWPNGAHGQHDTVEVVDFNHDVFSTPNNWGGVASLQIYVSNQYTVQIYLSQTLLADPNFEVIGRSSANYGTITAQHTSTSSYIAWGYDGGVDEMSGFGNQVIVNLVTWGAGL